MENSEKKNILIIKLGAKGDVVRTLCILPALKEKYPRSSITWITKENIKDLFIGIKEVDFTKNIDEKIEGEFDVLYNFDTDDDACEASSKVIAKEKYGFYKKDGYVVAYNLEAEYYLNTMFDDKLKKENRKTYQEMMFDLACLEWKEQRSEIFLNEKEKDFGRDFVIKNNLVGKKIIGIHMGAGPRWPSKPWHPDRLKEFIIKTERKGKEIILFGGPNELKSHKEIVEDLEKIDVRIHRNDPNNTNREFFSLIDQCDLMICSDSYALHVALSLRKKTIGLFFCTSPWEVEGYGLLKKTVADRLEEFFPEKMDEYDEELVKSISADEVMGYMEND